jgi:hypothetical protein
MAVERKDRTELAKSEVEHLRIAHACRLRQRKQPGPTGRETARSFTRTFFILPQICLIFWLLLALPSAAQKATGGIQGTLTDSAGAVVVGAAITQALED